MEQQKCVYLIKDLRNNKIIYVGKTNDYNKRKYCHFKYNTQFIDLYIFDEGRENFEMIPVDFDCANMSESDLLKKEDELIIKYDTINNGFNKNRSGDINGNGNNRVFKDFQRIEWLDAYNEYRKMKDKSASNSENTYSVYDDKEYHKKYYQEHKEQKQQYYKKYYQEHKEQFKQYQKKYYQEHKEQQRTHNKNNN